MSDLGDREAPHRLDILLIGCGLGGIAAAHRLSRAGHTVTILEAAHEVKEVGLGIAISPNVTRLLIRWGVGNILRASGVAYDGYLYLKHDTGQKLGFIDVRKAGRAGRDLVEDASEAPCMVFHRAELHKILYDLAFSSPRVSIRLNSRVVSINPIPTGADSRVSVTLASGETVHGDLVVGADGIKSVARQVVLGLGYVYKPEPTGDLLLRSAVPAAPMREDPTLRELFERPNVTIWEGKITRVVGYPISAGRQYNFVLFYPDDGTHGSAKGPLVTRAEILNSIDEIKEYEPRVQKIIPLIDRPVRWQLMEGKPVESWVHPAGRVVLLGDAAHPMLPNLGQGAAMAIEDAAVLGKLLVQISDISQLPQLLRAYEQLRVARVTEIQRNSTEMKNIAFDLEDEKDSEESPRGSDNLNCVSSATDKSRKTHLPSYEKYSEWFGYDAEVDVDSWWNKNRSSVLEKM